MSSRRPVALTPPDRILADIGRTTTITMFLTELSGVSRDVIVRALGNLSGPLPARQLHLEAGTTVEVDIDVAIPHGMPPGQHNFLFEVVDRDTGSVIDSLETSVDVQHTKAIRMHVSPASIRRRRRGRIRIIVRNHDEETQHLRLRAETDDPETEVRLEMPDVSVRPGELVRVSGRVKAKAFYIGKQKERWYSIIGDGAGTPIYTRGNVRQMPMIGKNIKGVMVLLTILMVWAGSTLAIIRAISPATSEVTAGASAGPADPGAGGDQDGAGAAGTEPILVDVTGTVTAVPDGSGVVVTWRTVNLGDAATEGKVSAGTSAESPDIALQQTETDGAGAFVVPGIDALGLYEFSFFKAGHQTKTIIVQPNGQPVTLEVALEAGSGFIGGLTVDAAGNPLGGVDVTLTDGAITYSLSTPTSGDSAGRFSFANLSSPATYVLDARVAGRGLASTTIELDTGQSIGDVRLVLTPDVATLAGKITAAAFESGSTAAADFRVGQDVASDFGPTFTITATDGSLTRSTTTLTEGLLAGTFRLEQLPVGRTYTITYEAPGFQTLTEQIELTLSTPEREISMVRSTGRLRGKVTITGSSLSPTAVAVTVTNPENTYKTTDAISSDGSLLVDGIVPGAYVVVFEALGLEKQVREVDIGAGTSTELNVTLGATRASPIKSSLSFKVVKGGGDTTTTVSATVKFRATGDCGTVGTDSDCTYDVNLADGNLKITGLEAGGYVIDFTAPGFAPRRIAAQVAASTDAPQQEVVMVPLGSLQGLVADDTSAPIQGLQLSLFLGTTLIGTTTTSATGEYLFSRKLLPETYTIKVTGAGFLPVERSVVGALAATLNLDITVRGKSLITGEVRSLDLLTGNFQAVEASKFTIYFRQNLAPSNGQWIDAATLGVAKSLGGYRLAVEPNKDPDATPPVNGPVIDVCVVASIETATVSAFTPTACDTPVSGLTSRKSTGIALELDETVTRSFYFSPTPGEVDGKVTIGGVAEEGVKVEARRVDSDGRVLESSSTLTDADGLFSFNALTPVRPTPASGIYTNETSCTFNEGTCWVIRASEEGTGFADSNLLTIYPGRVLSITTSAINIVKAGGTYNVTFTDDRGTPLEGVAALLYPKNTPPNPAWNGSCTGQNASLCKTSASGATTLSFAGLDPREYTIEARLTDYRNFTATVTITQGGAVDQIHKLSATKGGLIVDVRTIAGVSIVGAGVTVSGTTPPLACTTGNDGTCQIDGISEGVRTLVVSAPGYADTNVVATVIGGQTIGTAAVVGASSGSLYMSVVSSTGDSITGVLFTVTVGAQVLTCQDGGGTDVADGACLIDGVSAGVRATVTATATNYRSSTGSIGIGSGSSAISLVMTPARSATFGVTSGGAALVGATITATDSTGRTASCTDGASPENPDGQCAIDNLSLGPVTVVASKVGYDTRTLALSLTATQTTFSIELFPATAIALRGRITSNGSPVNGATVQIARGATTASTTSDSSGDYLFTNLASGSWDATVSATGYVTTARTGDQAIRLVTGTITNQDFVLAPSNGQLRFTVQTSAGSPIEGIGVTISAGSTTFASSSATGLVSFDGLAPGVYTVTVVDTVSPPRFAPQSFVVNVERGYTTNLPIHMGSTRSVVVVGVAGIPAVGFGPQTPLEVQVGLVSGATVVASVSAVVGLDRSIATFTEIPDGTYTITLDGVSTGRIVKNGVTYDVPTKTVTATGPGTLDAGLLLLPATKVAVDITVTDGGTALPGVSVTLSNGYLLAPSPSTSNNSGVASFTDVPPGTYALRLAKAGVATLDTTVVVPDYGNGSTHVSTHDLRSVGPARITVTAKHAGVHVPGAYVRIKEDNIGCTTANTGSCELLVPAGSWTLEASHPEYATITSPITTSANVPQSVEAVFATPSTGDVTITVRDTAGTAIAGAEVMDVAEPGIACATNASGSCSLLARLSTVHTYRISASGHATGYLAVHHRPSVTTSASIRLATVSATSTLTIYTVDAVTGNELSGVLVQNVNTPTSPSTICTTSSGSCVLSSHPHGLLNLRAGLAGHSTTSATVTVDANASTTVVLALQPNTSTVEVTVKDDADPHNLLTGVLVESHHGSTCTTSSGICAIPNLPSGAVTLTFVKANHESKTVVVGLVPGRTTSVTVTLRRTAALTVHVSPSPSTSATFAVVGHGTLCTILTSETHCTGQHGIPYGTWLISGNGYANASVVINSSTHTVTMSASP